jgi:apolipoprotein N-acyltransferase
LQTHLSKVPARRFEQAEKSLKSITAELLLLAVSALLFALAFPSFISTWGWFPLAYVALAPLFIVLRRASWLRTPIYGIFYGLLSYGLFNFWLGKFHPLALYFVPPVHAFYFLLLFPLLKLAGHAFPRTGFLWQSFLWVGYEFLKAQGFLAYSYGILGYSQYLFLPLIRIAAVTGVWGISLLVVVSSALLARALEAGFRAFPSRLFYLRGYILGYALVFLLALGYGAAAKRDLEDARRWKVALIQHNIDPWQGGYVAYERSLERLLELSGLAARESPEIVIWSETAFVPAIDWHTRYRTDHRVYGLVRRLREFLTGQEAYYLIGNDDGQLIRSETGQETRVDYNATLLFKNGEILETYRKIHLVPMTEHFPFRRLLPGIYRLLRNVDTHFWEKGTEATVFEAGGVRFSTPICFEDTFGYLGRRFVNQGAEVLVNVTNDSWSKSVAGEMQHMSCAVLRAVENRRSVVRATNGGITCIIDPNGRIVSRIEPFVKGYLVDTVPVYVGSGTLYTRWGDWFGALMLAISAGVSVAGIARLLRGRPKKD